MAWRISVNIGCQWNSVKLARHRPEMNANTMAMSRVVLYWTEVARVSPLVW